MATVYPFRQSVDSMPAANARHGPPKFPDQSSSESHHAVADRTSNPKQKNRTDKLDSCLIHFETAAREKFFQAIDDLPVAKLKNRFVRQLDNRIIPALTRIGFDESFARVLFQTAASGWQHMGPFRDKCTRLHPTLIKNLRTVRNEMAKTGSQSDSSWFILPRVYQYLIKDHSAYLLCYLDHLAAEPDSEFRRILTRIIIEFVGNYTLKFRDSILPRCLIDAALFYGYETMFWKNLRNPPPGVENDLIFNHFLRWVKLLRTKCNDLNDDMILSITQMEAYQRKVMLMEVPFRPGNNEFSDLAGLFVTLRHGRPGAEAAIKFLDSWLYSSRRDAEGRSLSTLLPCALNRFLNLLKIKLTVESPEVQRSLRRFLLGLKESFLSKGLDKRGYLVKSPEQFRFVRQSVLKLIGGATESMA